MSISLIIRNFAGTSFTLDVDPAITTVSTLKGRISDLGKGKSAQPLVLAFKGHELRDTRQLDHYGISMQDTIHILLPSTETRIDLRFETDIGYQFALSVNGGNTITQLRDEIAVEEKINVRRLQVMVSPQNPEQLDDSGEPILRELDGEAILSNLLLDSQVEIVVEFAVSAGSALDRKEIAAGKRPAGAPEFTVTVFIDERHNGKANKSVEIAVMGHQTLAEFEDAVLQHHFVNLPDYALILGGHELKEDEARLEDLGVVPRCTIHAVADVNICITTSARDFDMVVSPMTRISTIRSTLEGIDVLFPWDEFSFSLSGTDRLPETSTMWDLGFMANTMIRLKPRFLQLTVHLRKGDQRVGLAYELEANEDELVEGLKQRVFLESGVPPAEQLLLGPGDNMLSDHLTLKELGGREDIDLINLGDLASS